MAELAPLLFIAIAVVFLLVLPMRQRNRAMQRAQQLQASLLPGTGVMTTSGLFGTVAAIGDDTVDLEISPGRDGPLGQGRDRRGRDPRGGRARRPPRRMPSRTPSSRPSTPSSSCGPGHTGLERLPRRGGTRTEER